MLVSINYAPGLIKEFTLIGDLLAKKGFEVSYALSKKYKWMAGSIERTYYLTNSYNTITMLIDILRFPILIATYRKIIKEQNINSVLIYNIHPLNPLLFYFFPKSKCLKRILFLHEPDRPTLDGYSFLGKLYFRLVDLIQKLSVFTTTDIIVPSRYAYKLFVNRYPDYSGKVHVVNLLLPDLFHNRIGSGKRRYISVVGRFNSAKKIDEIINLINFCANKNRNLNFAIATSSDISKEISRLTNHALLQTKIINKPRLSDNEINKIVSESIVVLALQPHITQSGVLPVCFMNGTPLIARDIEGFSQFVDHESNGMLVSAGLDHGQIFESIRYIDSNIESMSKKCRESYQQVFSIEQFEGYYEWLIEKDCSEI